jgi:hypothetical protein
VCLLVEVLRASVSDALGLMTSRRVTYSVCWAERLGPRRRRRGAALKVSLLSGSSLGGAGGGCGCGEGFADELFALFPEGGGVGWVEGVGANAFADGGDVFDGVAHRFCDVAIFAVFTANFGSVGCDCRPYRGRGALLKTLPLQRAFAFGFQTFVDLLDALFDKSQVGVAREFGFDDAGVHGSGANSTVAIAIVEFDGEENICGFRAAVGDIGIVGCAFETGIVEIDVGKAVTGGRYIDEAAASTKKRHDAIDEDEVAEVIGAELRFEAVGGVTERRGHHAGVGDDDVERFAFGDEFVGSGTDTFEIAEVEFDEFETSAVGGGVFADLRRSGFGFFKIAGGTDDVRAVCGQSARGFNADSGGNAGNEDAFAFEVYPRKNFVRG